MKWYYTVGRDTKGPVTQDEFKTLIASGVISGDTMVWNQSMSDWVNYKDLGEIPEPQPEEAVEVPPSIESSGTDSQASSQTLCTECGKPYFDEELARFQDARVCASCKPVFLQKMREGVAAGPMAYGGFWIRFGAKMIDGIILGVINFAMSIVFGMLIAPSAAVDNPEEAFSAVFIPALILGLCQWGVNIAYTTFFVGKFAATPGKMVCGLKVVTAENGRVSYLRAFGRTFAELLSSLILGIGYIMAAFDDEKRSLHDRICSTRVIRK